MKKGYKGSKRRRVYNGETNTKSTISGLLRPTRNHFANFGAVLPGQMQKLVDLGLFREVPNPYGRGERHYEITSAGREYLKTMEKEGLA